jgi:membrane protease YdiL (CAAX protease family)
MTLASLRSSAPPPAVRFLLVAEVILYIGAVTAYVMLAAPASAKSIEWHHVVVFLTIGSIPICLNVLHGDRAADSGLRIDNLAISAREVLVATVVMGAGVAITGWLVHGFHWRGWGRLLELSGGYLVWGVAQQYVLQSFALRRLRQARLPPVVAGAVAACAFGALHAPNWPLVALTAAAGMTWCLLFIRQPNILTLGVAHGLLAVLLYHALPQEWLQGLTVGRVYLIRTGAIPR